MSVRPAQSECVNDRYRLPKKHRVSGPHDLTVRMPPLNRVPPPCGIGDVVGVKPELTQEPGTPVHEKTALPISFTV